MSRGAQSLKQGDMVKALKAAARAGLEVKRAKIDRDGSIVLDFASSQQAPSSTDWEDVR